MDANITQKVKHLLLDTRVMTIAVSDNDMPWSAPVYFVYHDNCFFFFSNKASHHIQFAESKKPIASSIFKDSDQIDAIFGLQMSGILEGPVNKITYASIVKKYVNKFNFLKKIFGPQMIDNKNFFLEKFKSHLYGFVPKNVYLSDNSRSSGKRCEIILNQISL